MNKIPKKLFSVLLALAMLVSLVPEQVFAADASNTLPTTPSVTRLESAQTVGVEFVPEDEADVSDTDAQQDTDALSSDSGGETASEDRQLFDEQNTTQDSTLVDDSASAELMADSHTFGDYTYTVSNGTATITGYNGTGGNISIPNSIESYRVTAIGGNAFARCASLISVELPEGLTSLGSHAFANCTSLTSVRIPSTVSDVPWPDSGPFEGCAQLDSVAFGEGIAKIPNDLFKNCAGLTHIEIPDTVTVIENAAFYGCGLTQIDVPDTVTSIQGSAFYNCSSLKTVEFGKGLKDIGGDAFARCASLISVELPEGLTSLGSHAFANCTSLTSVRIPSTVSDVPWPDSGPFEGCAQLDSVAFGEGIAKIPNDLFKNCAGLTHIEIPDTVTAIENAAFYGCSNLRTAMIGNLSCNIGNNVFSNCPNLTIYCPYASLTTIYAIEHDIMFEPSGAFVDNDSYVLDHTRTNLYADINAMSANGYVTITFWKTFDATPPLPPPTANSTRIIW